MSQPAVANAAATARARGADIVAVSADILGKIARRDNPQMVLGVVDQRLASAEEIAKAGPVLIALERIKDPGNLGTIIRTADARGRRRRLPGRAVGRSLLARSGARHHGLDLPRAAGPADGGGVRRVARRNGRARSSARICRAASIIAAPTIASRFSSSWAMSNRASPRNSPRRATNSCASRWSARPIRRTLRFRPL